MEFVTVIETRLSALSTAGGEDGIELSTIHGAKGREWDKVVLFGFDADQLPHRRALATASTEAEFAAAIEDERRLAYVAMTRAKKQLLIAVCNEPSPFLREADLLGSTPPLPTWSPNEQATQRSSNVVRRGPEQQRKTGGGRGKPAPPTIKARYPGQCSACGRPIHPGQKISPAR